MDKKVDYYKSEKIYNRLYGKTIEKENENYEKPCLEFTGYKNKNVCTSFYSFLDVFIIIKILLN